MWSMAGKLAANDAMLSTLAIIVLALLASGHFIWLLERKDNPSHFPKAYLDGVDDGLWCVLPIFQLQQSTARNYCSALLYPEGM